MNELKIVLGLAIIGGTILLFRLLGAWMLRINDVINELKEINKQLKNKL